MIYFENIFIKNNKLLSILKNYKKIVIITDSNIFDLYAEKLNRIFIDNNLDSKIIKFSAGEIFKTRETKNYLEDQLFEYNCHKDTCIIGLGGGVTTDLAGFVGATYFRGIDTIFIPTSLLAMVDASIGGKNGVNTEYGKNTIGTIRQPKYIFIDKDLLKTLPEKEYKFAFAEIIKHAIILDRNYFNTLFKDRDQDILELIKKSCEIKKNIIKQDQSENNIREILNFGHTIGHAIEKAYEYNISHGQAVSFGIIAESFISNKLGLLSLDDFNKILDILKIFDLKQALPVNEKLFNSVFCDKKIRNNKPRFVLIKKIGEVFVKNNQYAHEVPEDLIKEALQYLENLNDYVSSCI